MLDITVEDLSNQAAELDTYIDYYNKIAKPVVDNYSRDLDDKMIQITEYIDRVKKYNIGYDSVTIQRHLMELSAIVYFTNENLEKVGLRDDIAQLVYKTNYNEAYLTKQGKNDAGTKYSVKQLEAFAEREALSDSIVKFLYSRAYKILSAKVESADTMLRTLSKILSALIADMQTTGRYN